MALIIADRVKELSRDQETAWAAGLFEGEGCIYVGKTSSGRPTVTVTLGMCDQDVVERFMAWAAGGVINMRPSTTRWKVMHVWVIRGRACQPVLEQLLPHLGSRRSAKAHQALGVIATIAVPNSQKTHCPYGHSLADAYVRTADGSRSCRTCVKARDRQRRKVAAT